MTPKSGKASGRAPPGMVDALPTFEIAGKSLRIVLVDDIAPCHTLRRSGRRVMRYLPGEVVHFELCGHRYAMVCDSDTTDPDSDALRQLPGPGAVGDAAALLTNRELQIVQLICMGYLTKQVAARLKLSEFTVRSYLKTVYCKLGVRSRGAMVYRCAQTFLNAPRKPQRLQAADLPPEQTRGNEDSP